MPYSVVIADDHMLIRGSIRAMLEKSGQFEVCGEAGDGMEAFAAVKRHKPDLLVLDIAMPGTTGIEVIEEVRRWSPDTKIAVLTGVNSPGLLQHVVDSAVEGIFLKSENTRDWAEDFSAICAGDMRENPALSEKLATSAHPGSLTRRERQVLFGIARGEANAAIAERLGVSPNTIDKHRTSVMRKLQTHSAAELVTRAFKDGLLNSSDFD